MVTVTGHEETLSGEFSSMETSLGLWEEENHWVDLSLMMNLKGTNYSPISLLHSSNLV